MKIIHVTADTPAEAIRAVCYVRAWTVRELARQIGSTSSYLSEIMHRKYRGSSALRARILAHMPPGVIVDEPEAPGKAA